MNEREELLQVFFAETEDLLRSAETCLLALEANPESRADISELFRSMHTLKSGAAMVGFAQLSQYAHLLETLLERVREGKLPITRALISVLLEALDFIRSLVEGCAAAEFSAEPKLLTQHRNRIKRYLGLEAEEAPTAGLGAAPGSIRAPVLPDQTLQPLRYYQIDLKFRRDLLYSGRDPLLPFLGLSELGEFVRINADLSELPDFAALNIYDLYLAWQVVLKTTHAYQDVQDVFIFLKDDNDIHVVDITDQYSQGVDLSAASKMLGEVLVENGAITSQVLMGALDKQHKLGDILLGEGEIEPEELQRAVAMQEESRAVYRRTTLRVTADKLNNLVNLAEEMGIGLARMQMLLQALAPSGRSAVADEMESLLKVNREFQERVARVRMFPLEGTFHRFQRMARDLACQQNKQIKVKISGLDTELDKELIEVITDPMKHLVRNCVDHGIEPPEERSAKGKAVQGVIEFKAYQSEGRICIEIADDGRGIDWGAVRGKALELGWIQGEQATSPETLLDLLFRPGLSTSSQVTEVSGRGIGMDVVRSQLDQLKGSIQIHTEKDKGTRFILSLPLTFALMEALHVKVRGASYLLPLHAIVGTEKFCEELVTTMAAGEQLVRLRGAYVPLFIWNRLLQRSTPPVRQHGPVLVFLDTGGRTFAISVDEVLEPQQIIVKSLEVNFRSVRGVAGAAIMGDGSVALVLDVLGIEEMLFKTRGKVDAAKSCV